MWYHLLQQTNSEGLRIICKIKKRIGTALLAFSTLECLTEKFFPLPARR